MSGQTGRLISAGPYETEWQAGADVAEVYEQSRRSAVGNAGPSEPRPSDGCCERAGLVLGAFDARILAWLANYEP
jgi:hypothetical protein